MKVTKSISMVAINAIAIMALTCANAVAANSDVKLKSSYPEYVFSDNLVTGALGEIAPKDFIEHGKQWEKPSIVNVGGLNKYYVATGFGFPNTIIARTPKGMVVFETGESKLNAMQYKEFIQKNIDFDLDKEPLVAIVYTHSHYVNGTSVWTEGKSGYKIIATDRVMQRMTGRELGVHTSNGVRYQFGYFMPADGPDSANHFGLGPYFFEKNLTKEQRAEQYSVFEKPTLEIPYADLEKGDVKMNLGGTDFVFGFGFSDAPDSMSILIPEDRVVIHNVLWPTAFNIYTLRGDTPRDPKSLLRSADWIISKNPNHLISVHGFPIQGNENAMNAIYAHRDFVQFVNDQSARYINKGVDAVTAAIAIKAPKSLVESPYIPQFYGTMPHYVRQMYAIKIGWANIYYPENLFPLAPAEEAKRLVKAMGGAAKTYELAKEANAQKDYEWSLQLASYLIYCEPANEKFKLLKADTLREMGHRVKGSNAKSILLANARILDGSVDISKVVKPSILSPKVLVSAPISSFFDSLRFNVDPAKIEGLNKSYKFIIEGVGEYYGTFRNGVIVLSEKKPVNSSFAGTLTASKENWAKAISTGKTFSIDLIAESKKGLLKEFTSYFDFTQ